MRPRRFRVCPVLAARIFAVAAHTRLKLRLRFDPRGNELLHVRSTLARVIKQRGLANARLA